MSHRKGHEDRAAARITAMRNAFANKFHEVFVVFAIGSSAGVGSGDGRRATGFRFGTLSGCCPFLEFMAYSLSGRPLR
jgi:hypothetical protein